MVKQISLEVKGLLRGLSEDELSTLANWRSDAAQVAALKKILKKLSDSCVARVMYFAEEEPLKLALFKSTMRGQVRGLGILLEIIEHAEGEIVSRSKKVVKKNA